MRITEPWDSYLESLPAAGAQRASGRRATTLAGTSTDLRSQLFHSEDRRFLMNEMWEETDLSSVERTLLEFEISEKEKLGPWSIMFPWEERKDEVYAFDNRKGMSSVDRRAYAHALESVRALVPQSSVKPMSLESAWKAIPRNTSKGLPWLTRDNGVMPKYLRRAEEGIKSDDPEIFPFFLGWRGQAHGIRISDVRQRIIWEADKVEALISARWLYPMLSRLKLRREFAAWNDLDIVNGAVQDAFKIAEGGEIYSTDFSGFDASLDEELLSDVFDILLYWSDSGETSQGLRGVKENILSGGLLSPDGLLGRRPGGLPSGVEFTSLLGTLCNRVSAVYCAYALGVSHPFGTYLGDDAINVYRPHPSEDEVASVISDLGLDQNAEKQYVSREAIHYLQNLYVPGGKGGMRPLSRALNGMLSYERYRNPKQWSHAMATMRTIMQAENCKFHPRFEEFVKFISRGDGYLTQYPVAHLMKMAGGVKVVRETLGQAQFQYTSWSIESADKFEVSRVLRSLSQ